MRMRKFTDLERTRVLSREQINLHGACPCFLSSKQRIQLRSLALPKGPLHTFTEESVTICLSIKKTIPWML